MPWVQISDVWIQSWEDLLWKLILLCRNTVLRTQVWVSAHNIYRDETYEQAPISDHTHTWILSCTGPANEEWPGLSCPLWHEMPPIPPVWKKNCIILCSWINSWAQPLAFHLGSSTWAMTTAAWHLLGTPASYVTWLFNAVTASLGLAIDAGIYWCWQQWQIELYPMVTRWISLIMEAHLSWKVSFLEGIKQTVWSEHQCIQELIKSISGIIEVQVLSPTMPFVCSLSSTVRLIFGHAALGRISLGNISQWNILSSSWLHFLYYPWMLQSSLRACLWLHAFKPKGYIYDAQICLLQISSWVRQ